MLELEIYINSLDCAISYEIYKNRKGREIHVPNKDLMIAQKAICKFLNQESFSKYSTGFLPSSSIVKNAQYHKESSLIINLDIKKFFQSTNREIVYKTFLQLGYSKDLQDKLVKWCMLEDQLPTGAPTSPVISNLVLKSFDEVIGSDFKALDIRYSRYADDITISGDKMLDPMVLINYVKSQLPSNYILNKRKQRIYRYKKVINGLVVHKDKLSLGRRTKEELRNRYYSIGRSGISSLDQKDEGYLSYIHSFNIELETKLRDSFSKGREKFLRENLDGRKNIS